MQFEKAPDIKRLGEKIIRALNLVHLRQSRLFYYRSFGSKSQATARIWSFPRIFQLALGEPAAYVIEVISTRFDKLKKDEQEKVLIHEFLHIPKNFSGALLPHRSRGRHLGKLVDKLFKEYKMTTER